MQSEDPDFHLTSLPFLAGVHQQQPKIAVKHHALTFKTTK
jgi:hypothetical protein